MHRISSMFLILAWGLWLGGLIMLFLTVSSLFQTLPDHKAAGEAAAPIFHLFNKYQIVLAVITLLATFGCRPPGGSRAVTALFTLLTVAILALAGEVLLTRKIDHMRVIGDTHSVDFARFHGLSMGLSSLEALVLVVAGLLLPWVIQRVTFSSSAITG